MAQEIFLTQWFTDEMRQAGTNLVKGLSEAGAQVAAAFWILNSEEKTWELTIVSPLVKSEGPKAYFKRIQKIYRSAGPNEGIVSLQDIRVSGLNHPVVKSLKNSVLRGASLGNNRFGKNRIGAVFIEDMYLYMMDWDFLDEEEVCEVSA
jgi:hypothetical protein